MSNPNEWTIQIDERPGHERGFIIVDEYGEDVFPTRLFLSVKDAMAEISKALDEDRPSRI